MNKIWLRLLQFEFLAAGLAAIFGRFCITAIIGPERVDGWGLEPFFPVLLGAGFVLILLAGDCSFRPPRVS